MIRNCFLVILWWPFHSEYIVILDAQNLNISLKSILSVYLLAACAFGVIAEKPLPNPTQKLMPYAFSCEGYRIQVS